MHKKNTHTHVHRLTLARPAAVPPLCPDFCHHHHRGHRHHHRLLLGGSGALQILVANNGIGAVKAIRSMRKWVSKNGEGGMESEGGGDGESGSLCSVLRRNFFGQGLSVVA